MTQVMTQQQVLRAYNHPSVATLRTLLADFYTPEEFGLYLALPQIRFGGKSTLQMIYDGQCDIVVRLAVQLADGVYI